MIISATSDGLDESWLGKEITNEDLITLQSLSQKHGFNLSFEGGEAETFVTNCPLFTFPIKIEKSKGNKRFYPLGLTDCERAILGILRQKNFRKIILKLLSDTQLSHEEFVDYLQMSPSSRTW